MDEFFAQLDQLTLSQIEQRLSSWDVQQLVSAQEYLAQKQRTQTRAALAEQTETVNEHDAARLSVKVARRAHTTATIALIFSVGAMLAAIAAAVLALWLCEARRLPGDQRRGSASCRALRAGAAGGRGEGGWPCFNS